MLTKSIAEKRKAYRKYKLSQTASDFNSCTILKRSCEKEIRKNKREYEIKISQEDKKKPKIFVSYIRSKKTVRNNVGPLLDNDNKLISDDKGMASVLHSAFSKVFTKKNNTVIPTPLKIFQGPYEEKLAITELKPNEVRKYLQYIDPN